MPRSAHSRRAAPEASVEDLADELASVNLQGSSNSTQQVAARSPRTSGKARVNSPPPQSQSGSSRKRSTSTTTESASLCSTSPEVVAVQCSGLTKAGGRCKRVITGPPPSPFAPEQEQLRFCFQHTTIEEQPSGFHSYKAGAGFVKFEDWIPRYLSSNAQAALRLEMEKPASAADEHGYIYAYEIEDDNLPKYIKIKVGRTVELIKRLDQWAKQCAHKKIFLRGWWPGTVEDDEDSGHGIVQGRILAGEKGPFCHRLERLIHIELADLVINTPYIKPGFPHVSQSSAPSPKASRVRMPSEERCECGVIHKEIFSFRRPEYGEYKRGEWERVIKPVIERWGAFVKGYVDVIHTTSDDSNSSESTGYPGNFDSGSQVESTSSDDTEEEEPVVYKSRKN